MSDLLALVMTPVVIAAPLGLLVRLAARVRRRGLSGGYSLMGPFDEVWHPAAVEARVEVQVQDEAPAPSPGSASTWAHRHPYPLRQVPRERRKPWPDTRF